MGEMARERRKHSGNMGMARRKGERGTGRWCLLNERRV